MKSFPLEAWRKAWMNFPSAFPRALIREAEKMSVNTTMRKIISPIPKCICVACDS